MFHVLVLINSFYLYLPLFRQFSITLVRFRLRLNSTLLPAVIVWAGLLLVGLRCPDLVLDLVFGRETATLAVDGVLFGFGLPVAHFDFLSDITLYTISGSNSLVCNM